MGRPRILLILTEFPPRIGGMQTHAIYLARHLTERGYPVEVVTYQSVHHEDMEANAAFDAELEFPVHRTLSRLGFFHNFELIEHIASEFGPELVYCSTVFYGELTERLAVPVISRSVGNDVLRPWIAYPYRVFSRLVSKRWLEDPLNRFFQRFDYPEYVEALWRQRRRALMKRNALKLTHVMANSEFTADLLRGIGMESSRVQVLVGGVDAHRFEQCAVYPELREEHGIPDDRFLMLTACRMVKKKGVDFLIEVMPELVRRMPDLHLALVGGGRHLKRFRRDAMASEAADHITFVGRVPHEHVQRYYSIADAFVLASRVQVHPTTGIKDAETMGRVLCEANAAGLPVVASRAGGIPSVIQDEVNGLLFEPDDVESLADTLAKLRSDHVLRDEIRARGVSIARERFDWSVIVRAHEQCFQNVLEEGRSAPSMHDASLSGVMA